MTETSAPRSLMDIVNDIDKANGRDGHDPNGPGPTARMFELSKLAVELAEAVRRDNAHDELDELPARLWRGSTGVTVPQFLAVIRDRTGRAVSDENTAAEAVSTVFNLDMADVRTHLSNITNVGEGAPCRWAIPLSDTGYKAMRMAEGSVFRARDQFSGYTILVQRVV